MQIEKIRIDSIAFPASDFALRPAPVPSDKDYDTFTELKKDIASRGLLNLFSVRKVADGYEVIDGSRRFSAVKELFGAGLAYADGMVDVQIREADDYDALASQIAGNFHSKRTAKVSEIRAVSRIALVKGWDLSTTAKFVGMTVAYLSNLLKVAQLPEAVAKEVEAGNISVANAIQLTKLPADVITEHTEGAKTKSVADFTVEISQKLEALKASKQKKEEGEAVFTATPSYMKKTEAEVLLQRAEVAYQMEPSDYNKGTLDAMLEVFQLDEKTVAEQRAAWEQAKLDAETKKGNRKKEREAKKLAEYEEVLKAAGKTVI